MKFLLKHRKIKVLSGHRPSWGQTFFWTAVIFSAGLFAAAGSLWSDSIGEVQISRKYAGSLENGEVSLLVNDTPSKVNDLGINLIKISGKRMSIYGSVAGRGDIYEVRFNLEKFNEFLEILDDLNVEAIDAEIVKNGDSLELLGGVPGRNYDSEYVLTQILEGIGKEQMDIRIEPQILEPEVSANDLIDNVEILYSVTDDIYVLHDGLTVVVTRSDILKFLKLDCDAAGNVCGIDIPCVNVIPVREYAAGRLSEIWKGSNMIGVASNSRGTFKYEKTGYGSDTEDAVGGIVKVLSQRIENYADGGCDVLGVSSGVARDNIDDAAECSKQPVSQGNDTVLIGKMEVPGTDGLYADRYIEIDDSQQHLYVWEDGEVIMDFEMSGAFDEYAVFGVFEIREKSLNAWSDIAKKWMPYWMSFYYDPAQEAWYGIHELVWWDDANGIRHVEPSSRIGTRRSGGCLRLDRGKAELVYNWARVGELVLIHP